MIGTSEIELKLKQLLDEARILAQGNSNAVNSKENKLVDLVQSVILIQSEIKDNREIVFEHIDRSILSILQLDFDYTIPINESSNPNNLFNYIFLGLNTITEELKQQTFEKSVLKHVLDNETTQFIVITDKVGSIVLTNELFGKEFAMHQYYGNIKEVLIEVPNMPNYYISKKSNMQLVKVKEESTGKHSIHYFVESLPNSSEISAKSHALKAEIAQSYLKIEELESNMA